MTIMHEEWTERLSDYLDGELPPDERRALEAHLSGCIHCAEMLAELKRVVAPPIDRAAPSSVGSLGRHRRAD
jgi:anti-sigma factor RsiW